jgi:hypothetical protein
MQLSLYKYCWFKKTSPLKPLYCLWRPCLLMDRDKMSNLYREPSIDASYQVSARLAKRCQRKRFLKINNICIEITAFWIQISIFNQELSWPNGPKRGRKHLCELLIPFWSVNKHGRHRYTLIKYRWEPCLLMDQNEMSNRCLVNLSNVKFILTNLSHVFVNLSHSWTICPICILLMCISFCPDPLTNMASTGNSCFWLVDF